MIRRAKVNVKVPYKYFSCVNTKKSLRKKKKLTGDGGNIFKRREGKDEILVQNMKTRVGGFSLFFLTRLYL